MLLIVVSPTLRILEPFSWKVKLRSCMSTYEIILCYMNHMSTCDKILHIVNPHVSIWNNTAQYEPYVNIWNNTAHYISICWNTESNNIVHYKSICLQMKSYCIIWTICFHMKLNCVLWIHMSHTGFVVPNIASYVNVS